MKYLKIENKKGMFLNNNNEWKEIGEINRENLLYLIDKAVEEDFEMDEYDANELPNHAHQIIYENLLEKFKDLLNNKNRFKDEATAMYKQALEKYSDETNDN